MSGIIETEGTRKGEWVRQSGGPRFGSGARHSAMDAHGRAQFPKMQTSQYQPSGGPSVLLDL